MRSLAGLVVLGLSVIASQPAPAQRADIQVVPQLPNSVSRHLPDVTYVNSVAFSPNGQKLLTGSQRGEARLWNVADGALVRAFDHGPPSVSAVAFSPDGRRAATAATTIKIWDAQTGRLIHTLQSEGTGINALAFSQDGLRLISGDNDGTVHIWDVLAGQLVMGYLAHSEMVTAVAISPDGKHALSGARDSTVKLSDIATAELVQSYTDLKGGAGLKGPVMAVAFSSDGAEVFAALEQTVREWETDTGMPTRIIPHPPGGTAAFSPGVRRALVCCGPDGLLLTDLETAGPPLTLKVADGDARAFAFSPDGSLAVSAAADGSFALWDAETGKPLRTINPSVGLALLSVAVSSDGRLMVSGSDHNRLALWDLAGARLIRTLEGKAERLNSLAISSDARRLLAGDRYGGKYDLWDIGQNRIIRSFDEDPSLNHLTALFSPDGRILFSVGLDGKPTFNLLSAETGEHLHSLEGYSADISKAVFSPDGRMLLTGGPSEAARLWDTSSGRLIRTFDGTTVITAAFTPDGRRILIGGIESSVQMFDVASGKPIAGFEFSNADTFTFSPDGRYLLANSAEDAKLFDFDSGSFIISLPGAIPYETALAFGLDSRRWIAGGLDRTITARDVETGGIIRDFTGHTGPVTRLTMLPDGSRFASASADGTIRLWNIVNGDLFATFIVTLDGEWLIVTPEGFFSASAKGGELIRVVRGFDVFASDRVRDLLHRPDLVAEKIAGDPRGFVRDAVANLDFAKALEAAPH